MSCPHGDNENSCEHCAAVDSAWNRGFAAGVAHAAKAALTLRECDAALVMLPGDPARKTREKIAELIAEIEKEPS